MTKRTLCKIISIFLSCFITAYFVAVAIVMASYIIRPNANAFWVGLLLLMSIGNAVLMVVSQSRTAYYLSMLSILPHTILMLIIQNKIAIIIPLVYLVAYIIQKKLSIRIIGTIIGVLFMVIVVMLPRIDYTWSQSIETVGMDYYMSPDNTTEIRVEVSYFFEELGDYYDTYTYSVAAHKVNLINLGPIIVDGTYKSITSVEKLSEKPKIEISWTDSDTFLINGETYNIDSYIN